DRAPDALALEEGDHLAELTDAEPFDGIDLAGEFGLGLVEEGGGDQACYAGAAGGSGEGLRIEAVAGDEGDGFGAHDSSTQGGQQVTENEGEENRKPNPAPELFPRG